jgi:hypothetical protein
MARIPVTAVRVLGSARGWRAQIVAYIAGPGSGIGNCTAQRLFGHAERIHPVPDFIVFGHQHFLMKPRGSLSVLHLNSPWVRAES